MRSRKWLEPASLLLLLRKAWRQFRNVIIAVLVAGAADALWPPEKAPFVLFKPLHALEWLAYDALFVAKGIEPEKLDERIVVLGYDEFAEDKIEIDGRKLSWPPPREVHAQVIRNLKKAGARLIVYDMLFNTPSSGADWEKQDRALDQALKEAGNVVLACHINRDVQRKQISLDAPYYNEALGIDFEAASKIGFAEVPPEDDEIIRAIAPSMRFFDDWMPSLAARAFIELHDPGGEPLVGPKGVLLGRTLMVPNDGPAKWDGMYNVPIPTAFVDFRGGLNAFSSPVDFEQVYRNDPAIARLKDKVVFVGVTGLDLAKQLNDMYATSFSRFSLEDSGGVRLAGRIPGVVVQAHMLNTLLTASFLRPASHAITFWSTFLISLLGIGLSRKYLNWRGPLFLLLSAASYITLAMLLQKYNGIFLPWAIPMFLMVSVAVLVVWLERGSLKRRWSGYVSPQVLEQILKAEEGESHARRYRATIVFGDIRGFTELSDRNEPELVIKLLNAHFERLTEIIYDEKGTIDKFLGDGILAVFGAPVRARDASARAVRASVRMQEACLEPIVIQGQEYRLETGFGVTTGEFVAGHVGSRRRHDFSVIGDVVNVAARLQGVTGGAEVIIDGATLSQVERFVEVEHLGEVQLKGKPAPVPCYRVLKWDPGGDGKGPSSINPVDSQELGTSKGKFRLTKRK